MSRPLARALAVCLALCAASGAAEGADASFWRRLRETLASEPRQLEGAIRELVREDVTRRQKLDEAEKRRLSPAARERQAAVRAAYDRGQGRVLAILRRLTDTTAPLDPTARAALLTEAREIVSRLEEASRREPTSSGDLKVAAPALRPPPLDSTSAAEGTDGGGPIGAIPETIRRTAEGLAGPIEIYEWARNGIRPEFYYGVIKGPEQTLLDGSGNDADTAGLVIALLRAKGIPARFVRGTVEIPVATLLAVTGTRRLDLAVRVLERAAIPHETVPGPGGIVAVRAARTWAEAYVAYANYRGTQVDGHGKFWIPLDAAFKRVEAPGGIDVVADLGVDPRALLDDYLAAPQEPTALQFLRGRIAEKLAERPGTAYEDVLNRREVVFEQLGILPSSLPFRTVSITERGYALPDALHHTVRFVAELDGRTLLDHTARTVDLLGRRLTLAYTPASEADEEVAREFGGVFRTPPYLLELRPVLRSGGVTLAAGTSSVGLGVRFRLRMELVTPAGSHVVENAVTAGNLLAVAFGGRRVASGDEIGGKAAQVLSGIASEYLERWNASDEELSALFPVVPVRPTVSVCLALSEVDVEYAGGDPLYPLTFEWKGIALDADLRATAPVGVGDRDHERAFLLLSGLEGSVLEHRVFEEALGIPAVSTAKALGLARQAGIAIHDVTAENVDDVLPALSLDAGVKREVEDAARRGFRALVPATEVPFLAWTGVGYLLLDEETGEAAHQLQGGHSGGITAPASFDIPREIRDALVEQEEEVQRAPADAQVAAVRKIASTDFQEGTVDKPLGRPLRVRLTDRDGGAVADATVVFTVLGGGGRLFDPKLPGLGDTRVTVRSNERGEAEAILVLGRKTDVIPRYVTEEGDEHATRVGLNLVAVTSGSVLAPAPFTAIGFPDRRWDGLRDRFEHAWTGELGTGNWWPNLAIGGLMKWDITDQHGNPLSNVKLRIAYRPDPVLTPPPPGWVLERPATTTPGRVLSLAAFQECHRTHVDPSWGECPGEAAEVVVNSSTAGAFAYAVLGDSPHSQYRFDFGTLDEPQMDTVAYHTSGWICRADTLDECPASLKPPPPQLSIKARPFLQNSLGNDTEAYLAGGVGSIDIAVHQISEKEQIVQEIDAEGNTHFRARGTNVWRREPVTNASVTLVPETPGTEVPPSAPHAGGGNYRAPMTMGRTPQLNVVRTDTTAALLDIPYLGGDDVDPAYVAPDLTVQRIPRGSQSLPAFFALWGIALELQDVTPSPVALDAIRTVSRPATVRGRIEPEAYRTLLAPHEVLFTLAREGTPVLAAHDVEPQYVIPAGLPLPPGDYEGGLSVLGLSANAGSLHSPPLPIATCQILDLLTPKVDLAVVRDPLNGVACGTDNSILFNLCRAAMVSVTLEGQPLTATVDAAGAPAPVTRVLLGPGVHSLRLSAGFAEELGSGGSLFRVTAEDVADSTLVEEAQGLLDTSVQNRSVRPVGHTFVKGVDLLDGHLVQQAIDLRAPGRHLGLELTRTYSSAGRSAEGSMGAGWAWNYGSQIIVAPPKPEGGCGLVSVITADGDSQVFRSPDNGLTFLPQRGYHTELRKVPDGYDFIDKPGMRHHFREPQAGSGTPAWRLDYIEDPHGDRLAMEYDTSGRLVRVREVQPERGPVRTLQVTYVKRGGYDRIGQVTIPELALAVSYEYDEHGNLVRVRRSGANLGGPAAQDQVLEYRYSVTVARDPHQLVSAFDPNGNQTRYEYFRPDDPFPGSTMTPEARGEFVRRVVEFPRPGQEDRTEFQYDLTDVMANQRWKTTVRLPKGNRTLYVLNGNGNALRIEETHESGVRVTAGEWSNDSLKTSATDALGRVTRYDYDARGNLTAERILSRADGSTEIAVTGWEYDPRLNKLVRKTDAEDRVTVYEIDPGTGDLRRMQDAVGNVTRYEYDGDGRGLLVATIDPRAHQTTHSGHTSFGAPTEITDPLGNRTTREYDERGRLLRETDTSGRRVETVYDGRDRPVLQTRFVGTSASGVEASDDAVTVTSYYAGGQVRELTNPNGAVVAFTLDGLNRVVSERTTGADGGPYTTTRTYDENGNKETETDRRGVTRRFAYDQLNRLREVSILSGSTGGGPFGTVATFEYDAVGNKTAETNVAGDRTEFAYDDLYRVTTTRFPEGSPAFTEVSTFDRVGNRLTLTDRNGHETRFAYDGLNRLFRTENPLGHVMTARYDDAEGSHVNKSEENDETRGLRTTFQYDDINREVERVVHLEGPGGEGRSYRTATRYEDPAHLIVVTDPRLTETETRLDGLDRPIEVTVDPAGLALVTRMSYDGLGNRKALRNPRGHVSRFEHDGLGRLARTTDALTQTATAAYDGEGLRATETDRRGVIKRFTYDSLGRPRTTSIDPTISGVAWSQETEYQDVAHKRVETDARGKRTSFDLDRLGRVVKVTDPHNKTVLTSWDGVNKRAETDRRGHTTRFDYDKLNRLAELTDPAPFDAQTIETTYEDALNRRTEKDRRGVLRVTQMDPLGRVATVTRAGIVLETNAYDPNGSRISMKDAENKETGFVYDPINRLSARTDGIGTPTAATTILRYDANGNQSEELDPRAADVGEPFSMRHTYDELDRVLAMTDGEANVTTFGYDPEGNRTSLTEPETQVTNYSYDELGKLLSVTQPAPASGQPRPVTTYAYDQNRNRIRQIDANGHVVEMAYDDLNRLTSMTQDPGSLNLVTTHVYDANGNETLLTDPKGQTVSSTYDELNRLKTKTYAFAAGDTQRPWRHTAAITYTYDANSNLTTQDESVASGTDPPSATLSITRTFDDLDLLLTETETLPDGGTRAATFTYFANGTRRTTADPDTGTRTYAYDGQNRLESVTDSAGTTTYTYWPDDLQKIVTGSDGVVATHGYDKADRLISLASTKDGTTVTAYAYSYDRNGNRLTQAETNGGPAETTTYTHDGLNRLATVAYPADASHPDGRHIAYGYDAVGNRTTELTTNPETSATIASKSGIFDNVNRLTTLTDNVDSSQTTTFTWDANGNQTSKTVGSTVTEYRYDVRDKLVEVAQGASILERLQYDAEGRLLKKIGESGTRQYLYDQTSRLVEYDETGTQVASYTYGFDRLISLQHRTEGTRFYHLDGLGSVTALTDPAGAVTSRLHLDAWGIFKNPTELDASANRHAFTGYIFERETGLYFAKARFYDPTVGRFTSQDSFLGSTDDPPSLHRYFYANANPTRFIDPTGHANETVNRLITQEEANTSLARDLAAAEQRFYANEAVAQSGNETPEGTVHEEGTLATALRWYAEKKGKAKRWVEDHAGALGRKFFNPGSNPEREEQIQVAFQGTHSAESAAQDWTEKKKIGEGLQQVSGDITAKGGELGTEAAIQYAEAQAGGRLIGAVATGAGRGSQALRGLARSADEASEAAVAERYAVTAERIGTRRLPQGDNPWIKYQEHVTGRRFDEMWRVGAEKAAADARRAGYTVEAKWAGRNDAAWKLSPYNPRSRFYDEPAVLDQAKRLIQLDKATGGKGVRYAVSNPAARSHFEGLFRQNFPGENIQVWHVPGTGMGR